MDSPLYSQARREGAAEQRKMPAASDNPTDELQIASDRRLARRICRGDQEAIQMFCNSYFPKVYRFALARLPTEQDAEDVVQVVLTNAARRMETYRGEAPLLGWLYQITRREVSKQLGAAARHADLLHVEEDASTAALVARIPAPESDEPDVASGRKQFARRIHALLDLLPDHYARALELKYVDGYSTREIARSLDMGDVAVQSLLARARHAFRELCDPREFSMGAPEKDRA